MHWQQVKNDSQKHETHCKVLKVIVKINFQNFKRIFLVKLTNFFALSNPLNNLYFKNGYKQRWGSGGSCEAVPGMSG